MAGCHRISDMIAVADDAWATATANGARGAYDGNSAGNTRNSRIDYIWYSKKAAQLVLKGAAGVRRPRRRRRHPSDHRPVMATFQVGSGSSTITPVPTGLRIVR